MAVTHRGVILNETVTSAAKPFRAAPNTERRDEAPTPDISEAAMTRLRSPFETADGERADGRTQQR
jgi:hypothetical protein